MDFTLLTIIVLLLAAAIYLKYFKQPKGRYFENTQRPPAGEKPSDISINDRVIKVTGAESNELKEALIQCCNSYNQEAYNVMPKLTETAEGYVITFPFGVSFEYFCYSIVYLSRPNGIEYQPEIKAWTTLLAGDSWIYPELEGKQVMISFPEESGVYPSLLIITEENINYIITFNENTEFAENPVIGNLYLPPPEVSAAEANSIMFE